MKTIYQKIEILFIALNGNTNISQTPGLYLCSYVVTTIRMTKLAYIPSGYTVKSKQTVSLYHCPYL
jgi:hypothetical protein